MLKLLKSLFGIRPKARYRAVRSARAGTLVISISALEAVKECLTVDVERRHEGIAYLFGQTDGETTVIMGAIKPEARTTAGSFKVSSAAMSRVVRATSERGLQLVGQLHSHPQQAFHSEGDEDGALIAFEGFVSVVVPDYGRHLPTLEGAAAYIFRQQKFLTLATSDIHIVPSRLS